MCFFLHGFLGQKEDWLPLFSHLSFPINAIDLPGHGKNPMAEDIVLATRKKIPAAEYLIGYSAGGRIALELKKRFPHSYGRLILLSTHLGIIDEKERKLRLQQDEKWIEMLHSFPFEEFLKKWYDQKLFHSLKKRPYFSEIFEKRKMGNPFLLAKFLKQYSIAKKSPHTPPPGTIFIYGEEDLKYADLYRKLADSYKIYSIENAGHAVHIENPKGLAEVITKAIHEYDRNSEIYP